MPKPVGQAQSLGSAQSSAGPVWGKPCHQGSQPRAGRSLQRHPALEGPQTMSHGFGEDAARQVRHDPETSVLTPGGAVARTEPPGTGAHEGHSHGKAQP